MGMFEVNVRLANIEDPARFSELSLIVDTGATLSWIPRTVLQGLGVEPLSRLPFSLADGSSVEREIGGVLLIVDGRRAAIPVAFAESGETALLGATALETLGFVADPVEKRLSARDLLALASGPAS